MLLDFGSITITTILSFLGVAAGALGSMLGVGGGIIIAPVLTFIGFTPPQIASTSLFGVVSTSASSTIAYARQKRIDYKTSIKLAIPAIPGAILGGLISHQISAENFKLYFAILLLATSVYLLFIKRSIVLKGNQKQQDRDDNSGNSSSSRSIVIDDEKNKNRSKSKNNNNDNNSLMPHLSGNSASVNRHSIAIDIVAYSSSFVAGVISSLFGVGGGIIFVPVMIIIYRFGMHRAAPTSQLSLLITSIAGLLTHSILFYDPQFVSRIALGGIALAIGTFVGAQIGARYSASIREKILQQALAIVLIAVAIELIVVR